MVEIRNKNFEKVQDCTSGSVYSAKRKIGCFVVLTQQAERMVSIYTLYMYMYQSGCLLESSYLSVCSSVCLYISVHIALLKACVSM